MTDFNAFQFDEFNGLRNTGVLSRFNARNGMFCARMARLTVEDVDATASQCMLLREAFGSKSVYDITLAMDGVHEATDFGRHAITDTCTLLSTFTLGFEDAATFQRVDPDTCVDLASDPVSRDVQYFLQYDVLATWFKMNFNVPTFGLGGTIGQSNPAFYNADVEGGTAVPGQWYDNELTGEDYNANPLQQAELSSGGRIKLEVFPWKD